MRIINDTHIDVARIAGTTPASADALKSEVLANFRDALRPGDDILLLGDLFDRPTVDSKTLLTVWGMLSSWLIENQDSTFYLVRGNHDMMNNTDKIASIDLLAGLLTQYGNFVYITTPTVLPSENEVVIPHMRNQDLFDMAVAQFADKDYILFTHCNYDLCFANDKDHSLNLSRAQAKAFMHVVIAHEHQYRTKDNVIALGCQFPTSIADVKDGKDKYWWDYVTEYDPDLEDDHILTKAVSWDSEEHYTACDWRELDSLDTSWQFVRVVGEASEAEASTVLQEITKLRKRLPESTFVISNAVVVEGITPSEDGDETLESLEGLNIIEMLLERVSKKHAKKIREVIENA